MNAIPHLNVVYDRDATTCDAMDPFARLTTAIGRMTISLEDQKTAVAFFQERMTAVSLEVKDLKTDFRVFGEALERIDARRLRRKALRLASMMEGCERRACIRRLGGMEAFTRIRSARDGQEKRNADRAQQIDL